MSSRQLSTKRLPLFRFYGYRRSDFYPNYMGAGFWVLLFRRWRFCADIVYPGYLPRFSERYGGHHGIPKCRVLYVPIGSGRRLRLEVMRGR